MSTAPITRELAKFAVGLKYDDIPAEAIDKAKDCILDQLGVELIGSTLKWNKIALPYVANMGGRAESTIVNHGTRALTLDAAFVNATFGQGCELDDVGFAAGGHISAATVPYRLLVAVRPWQGHQRLRTQRVRSPLGRKTIWCEFQSKVEPIILILWGPAIPVIWRGVPDSSRRLP